MLSSKVFPKNIFSSSCLAPIKSFRIPAGFSVIPSLIVLPIICICFSSTLASNFGGLFISSTSSFFIIFSKFALLPLPNDVRASLSATTNVDLRPAAFALLFLFSLFLIFSIFSIFFLPFSFNLRLLSSLSFHL